MKRVLVTGAGGFLGSAVVERLAKLEEYETTAAVSGRHPVSFPANVRVEAADLLDESARTNLLERTRPDIMLHLAWSLDDNRFLASESNVEWLEASLHLCRLFRQEGGSRLVFAGSSSEYGTGFTGYAEVPRKTEFSLYGSCKSAFEQVAGAFCGQNEVGFASARYFSIYGPGDDRPGRALPLAIRTMLKGEPFRCAGPRNIWDYIYIDDAAEATVRLLVSPYCGPVNIASGKPQTMREVFTAAAELIGVPGLLTFDESQAGFRSYLADTERMESALHYRCPTPFREGLEKTIQWWREKLA